MAAQIRLNQHLEALSAEARVCDFGGWRSPNPAATHLVDLFPYETRGLRDHQPAPLPGEKFTRDTWTQANFLDPQLHLPFEDGYFDFGICTHTIEDLDDPEPLLREIRRVCRAGYLKSPSRLAEQTIGVRDRMTSRPGHPHHRWIVDVEDGQLLFWRKEDSLAGPRRQVLVPLRTTERLGNSPSGAREVGFLFEESFDWRLIWGEEARRRAEDFVQSLSVPPADYLVDGAVRFLRGLKYRAKNNHSDARDLRRWREVLERSRKYSKIPLPD